YFVFAGEKNDDKSREGLWIQKSLSALALVFMLWMGRNGFFHHTLITSWQPLHVLVDSINDSSSQNQIEEEMKASLRKYYKIEDPLLELIGEKTVDIFPWEISLAYAYDLKWKPRPVMQSYVAYTPQLDKLNSDYFERTPPETVLYEFRRLGDMYPVFYEPKTLVTLMRNYSLMERFDRFLLLERNAQERQDFNYKKNLLKQVRVNLGERIAIPDYSHGFVFAEIDVDLSTYGKVVKSLFRPSRLFIEFLILGPGGQDKKPKYRLVRSLGTEGLLVSDHISDVNQLETLFKGEQHPNVKEVVLIPEFPSHFDPEIRVTFYGVPKNEMILGKEAGAGN
ncbi:MAG: hypothetical protein O6857_06080, partial [Nitrospinae bacterium]|nr:hypothetical protein [Nitrospinota bacterium]